MPAGAIYMDYSKQCIDETVLTSLLNLADSGDLSMRIEALLQGAMVNTSEERAALHTALRLPAAATLQVGTQDVVADVHHSLAQVERLSQRIRSGSWRGFSGKAITDVVNIGVGGSDLGPLMATTALDEWADTAIVVHFVSNMDGSQLDNLLKRLNAETTLFIISSKSLEPSIPSLMPRPRCPGCLLLLPCARVLKTVYYVATLSVSQQIAKMSEWGIHPEHQLQLWDWVGDVFPYGQRLGWLLPFGLVWRSFVSCWQAHTAWMCILPMPILQIIYRYC